MITPGYRCQAIGAGIGISGPKRQLLVIRTMLEGPVRTIYRGEHFVCPAISESDFEMGFEHIRIFWVLVNEPLALVSKPLKKLVCVFK